MGSYSDISFGRDRELLKQAKPYHYDPAVDRYCCGCDVCEQWRAARVWPGSLCRPATKDPSKSSPGTVPAWRMGAWETTGWSFRMEANQVDLVMVIGSIDKADESNGGHLDCVVVLTQEPEPRLLVTSRKWLVAL